MKRCTALVAALALVTAGCRAATTPTPTATLATRAPAPTTTPAPAAPAPSSAARLIPATVTFDGSTCTYAGPTVVPTGSVIEWTLVNTPAALDGSIGGAILAFPVKPGTTWEDVVAYHATNDSLFDPPPWLGNTYQFWTPEDAAAGVPMRTLVGPYALMVSCANADGDDPRVFPAVLIQVMKG
jgi:hypothetical protein